jgi:hypothetical protein
MEGATKSGLMVADEIVAQSPRLKAEADAYFAKVPAAASA